MSTNPAAQFIASDDDHLVEIAKLIVVEPSWAKIEIAILSEVALS